MSKRIVITIDGEGNCSVEGKNFVGSECSGFICEIEKILGDTTSRTKTKDYQAIEVNRNRARRKEYGR